MHFHTHHAAFRESAQAVEVEVPEPRMPSPDRVGTCVHSQAHRLGDSHCQLVHTVRFPPDLCQELSLPITHSEEPVLDQHLAAILIELAQADDLRVQPGYVVHPGDGPVLV